MPTRKDKINDFEKSSRLYFNEINKFMPLSKKEAQTLWESYKEKNDLKARDKLLKSNLKFVASVARKYQGLGLSYADLISEGNIGLLKSFDKFDYTKGNKTISYAIWWIRQTILEALKSRNLIDADEIEEYRKTESTDYETESESDYENHDSNYTDNTTILSIKQKDDKSLVELLCKCLTHKEMFVINKYFGLGDNDEMTLEAIGDLMGLTKERVRQIKERGLRKLRAEAIQQSVI
jgi:RNA polymerase primary sigma factor